ncbi:MAG: hypothetical protein RLN84_01245 [Rhodospirillaceae bacterium]
MSGSRTYRHIDIGRAFDPDDPLGVHMATLAIVSEDMRVILYLIVPGTDVTPPSDVPVEKVLSEEMVPVLVRAFLVALEQALSSVNAVHSIINQDPSRFESEAGKRLVSASRDLNRLLSERAQAITNARNKVGGHLDQAHVARALRTIPAGHTAAISYGPKQKDVRFHFGTLLSYRLFEAGLAMRKGNTIKDSADWTAQAFFEP